MLLPEGRRALLHHKGLTGRHFGHGLSTLVTMESISPYAALISLNYQTATLAAIDIDWHFALSPFFGWINLGYAGLACALPFSLSSL